MQSLNSTLGSYMPAFFHMDLSFPFPSGALAHERLNQKHLSIFTHEYIHFIQDVSTYVGLNNAYVYSECIHGIANTIYQQPKGELKIPVKLPRNYGNIELNQQVNKVGIGTFEEQPNFFLKKIKIKKEKVLYDNSFVKNLTEIVLVPMKGQKVVFGSRAIMESMAYLMETMITKGSVGADDYPYHAAEIVANYYYPEFGKDKLRLIALCDASMQFSEPGKIFVQSLQSFKKEGFLPSNANDVIDHFYLNPCVQMGEEKKIEIGLLTMGFMVGERLKQYMNHPLFKPFHNVVHNLIGFGMRERLNNKYFMLDIVRNGDVLDNAFMRRFIRTIGTPIIIDSNDDYWNIPPIGKTSNDYWLEYFPAIEELFKCLAEGQTICELYPWCEKSPMTKEDNRCIEEPWSRVNDEALCPYAMLWKHWKLEGYFPKE